MTDGRRVRGDVVRLDLRRAMVAGSVMLIGLLQEPQSARKRRLRGVERLVMRRGGLRGRVIGVEGPTTNAKASSLEDLPVDDTHADQWDVESTDGGDDRVGNVADQMALIGGTTARIAKDRKEMRTGDDDRRHPNHADQNQHTSRSAFRAVIH